MRCILSEHFSTILNIKVHLDARIVVVTCEYSASEKKQQGKYWESRKFFKKSIC